jgi:hypothetical protein
MGSWEVQWLLRHCRRVREKSCRGISSPRECVRFGRVQSHQPCASCVSSHWIVCKHNLSQRTRAAVKGAVAFHDHNAVCDNEVDRNCGAYIKDALLNAFPIFQWRMFLGDPRTNRLRRSALSPDSPVARFQQAVWCGRVPQRLPRPLGRNFKLILTVDLLREVSLIGTVAEGSQQSQADGHIRLGHRDGGKIGLTQCAERSWLPGLPPSRINGSGSSYRLCNAGLCHFFFHFSEGSVAERSLLVFAWHDTIIMSCSESQERSI